jgi:hypothetical protein
MTYKWYERKWSWPNFKILSRHSTVYWTSELLESQNGLKFCMKVPWLDCSRNVSYIAVYEVILLLHYLWVYFCTKVSKVTEICFLKTVQYVDSEACEKIWMCNLDRKKISAFWDVAWSSLGVDRHFRGAYCLHHEGVRLHGATSQKALIFILTAVRTWNFT